MDTEITLLNFCSGPWRSSVLRSKVGGLSFSDCSCRIFSIDLKCHPSLSCQKQKLTAFVFILETE